MTPRHPTRRQALARWTATLALPMLAMPDTVVALPVKPAEIRSALPEARMVGSAVLRFFGLRVYEARLWAGPGFRAEDYAQQPFALELTYERKLEGEAIAERSLAEMRRVGPFDDVQGARWLALMKQAFPDVTAQDRLLGLNDGRGEVRFFHNDRPTARTHDAEYARLFFGIWLAPQTSAPALRASLLGAGR